MNFSKTISWMCFPNVIQKHTLGCFKYQVLHHLGFPPFQRLNPMNPSKRPWQNPGSSGAAAHFALGGCLEWNSDTNRSLGDADLVGGCLCCFYTTDPTTLKNGLVVFFQKLLIYSNYIHTFKMFSSRGLLAMIHRNTLLEHHFHWGVVDSHRSALRKCDLQETRMHLVLDSWMDNWPQEAKEMQKLLGCQPCGFLFCGRLGGASGGFKVQGFGWCWQNASWIYIYIYLIALLPNIANSVFVPPF